MAERPADLSLPNAVIMRIIKEMLPEGVSVAKEARNAITRAASVFVLFATSSANNLAQKNKKKTVSGQDVFAALKEMEFEKFIEPLQESLEVYKKSQQNKKEQKEAKAKAKKAEEANNKSLEPSEETSEEADASMEVTEADGEDQDIENISD